MTAFAVLGTAAFTVLLLVAGCELFARSINALEEDPFDGLV